MYDIIERHSEQVVQTHWFFTIDGIKILQSDLYAYCTDVRDNNHYDRQCFVDIHKRIDDWLCLYNIVTPCHSGLERSSGASLENFIEWMEGV